MATILSVYCIFNALVIYLLTVLYPENAVFYSLLVLLVPLTIEFFALAFDYWNRMVLLSFEKKGMVIRMVVVYGMFMRSIAGYFFVIYMDYGVYGMAISECFCIGLRSLTNLGVIYSQNWVNFKGANTNNE